MWTSSFSSSSSSSSSSATSLSSSSSSPSPYAASNPKTMEEVWNDITLDLHHHHHSSRGVILQDFFSRDPPPTAVPSPATPPPPPPPTMLTLNSGHLLFHPHYPISAALLPAVDTGKKRPPETDRSSGDHRHKRMIKNRESAARSRARKQAYTNELELEVARLLEENAKLRKHQEQFYRESAAENQKRKPLHRTSTAPF